MAFRNTILTTAGVVVVGATCIGLYNVYSSLTEFKKTRSINSQNFIPLITSTRSSLMSSLTKNNDAIDSKSFCDFSQLYDKLDLDKDITVIIHTHGGMMSSGEAIINMILNHNVRSGRTGKIKCFIPHFAYSCGFLIALACDEIVMYRNAIVGPCDAQMPIGSSHHSLDAIIKTVEYKKAHDQKIDENWYASYTDALKCVERQQALVKKLTESGQFSEELGERIHNEFFTGKYNHDKIFTPAELQEIGIKVTIVDEIPDNIKSLVGTES